MEKSVSLDIAALVLLMVLVISRISRKMIHDKSNRIFLTILIVATASTVFDIVSVLLDRTQCAAVPVLYIAHMGYLLTHYLSVPLYLLLIISLTDTWHKIKKNRVLPILLLLPLTLVLIAFAVNPVNQLVFSVENGYQRGPLFSLLYVTTILYILIVILYIIRYRKLFDRGEIAAVSAIVPIDVAAMLIQFYIPTALVEIFCGAIGLLIMSTSLQRPEDYTDTFTHLMKHSAYVHDMKQAFYNDKHVYIIMLNISNFQKIQTIIGFNSTTDVLKIVADKIRQINRKMRGHANLYYLDNGRFRIVFQEENQDKAEVVADTLNQELKKQININDLKITLMPFIILAHCPEEIQDFKTLMSFGSDFHLKNYCTGQVMFASKLYSWNQLNIQNNIDRIIEQALETESFQVYYQPIYSTQQKRYLSAEALLRLIDPEHGFISPEILVNAAESSGAIHQIGEFVFEKVCQFIASDEFAALGLDYIEVNLSMAQLMNADLAKRLLSIMNQYGVSPNQLNLEITESITAYEQQALLMNIEKLTDAGLSFSLDDYGTGYSNIKRIIRLPLRIIKLDKSFVDEKNNPKMWIILKNTIKMLKEMNMEIVVEGIETQDALDAFSKLQCDFIQGYFFSKPIPRNEFVTFISNANGNA
ncbi:MAG: EAL domain-containing protein [Clostridium sp.]|nr:EAL domain-containing protein [Clostridium sp.]